MLADAKKPRRGRQALIVSGRVASLRVVRVGRMFQSGGDTTLVVDLRVGRATVALSTAITSTGRLALFFGVASAVSVVVVVVVLVVAASSLSRPAAAGTHGRGGDAGGRVFACWRCSVTGAGILGRRRTLVVAATIAGGGFKGRCCRVPSRKPGPQLCLDVSHQREPKGGIFGGGVRGGQPLERQEAGERRWNWSSGGASSKIQCLLASGRCRGASRHARREFPTTAPLGGGGNFRKALSSQRRKLAECMSFFFLLLPPNWERCIQSTAGGGLR